MEENYLEAKKLFNKYGNSIKNIMDDSLNKDHKTYLQYQVPEETELEWIHEYQEKITVKILRSKNNKEILKHYLKLSENMCHNQYYKNLPSVLKQLSSCENEIDSFTKLRIAKTVINTIKNGLMTTQEEHTNDINKIGPIIVSWLEGIIHKPIEVDDSFLEDIPETEIFNDYIICLEPENILNEAKSILTEWEDHRGILAHNKLK